MIDEYGFNRELHGNWVLCGNEKKHGKRWYVSFRDWSCCPEMGSIPNDLVPPPETALVCTTDSETEYLIVHGDKRREYAEAIPLGFDACVEVYERLRAKENE